jgi:hypothetical protein
MLIRGIKQTNGHYIKYSTKSEEEGFTTPCVHRIMKKVLLGIRRTGCVEFSTILH